MNRPPLSAAVVVWAMLFAAAAFPAERGLVWDGELGWIDMAGGPGATPASRYAYAKGLFIRGDFAAAAEVFESIERLFPGAALLPRATLERARCETRLGRHERAARIAAGLLQGDLGDIPRTEVVGLEIESLRLWAAEDGCRAAERLNVIAARESLPEVRCAAFMAEGDAWMAARDSAFAAEAYHEAASVARDDPHRLDALYAAATADVTALREGRDSPDRIERAAETLRRFNRRAPVSERIAVANALLRALEKARGEPDKERRRIYYALTRLPPTYLPDGAARDSEATLKRGMKRFAQSPAGETAHFHYAECLYLRGRLTAAYKVYESFLKAYRDSDFRRRAVERQFAIGEELSRKGKWSAAVTILTSAAENDPNGPLADDAYMYVGQIHLERRRYGDAKAAFDTVVQTYPRSEWAPAALFHAGYCDLTLSPYSEDNEQRLADARGAFEVYLSAYPQGPFAAEAKEHLKTCRERQADTLRRTGEFYQRQGRPRSAAIYFAAVVAEHPDTPQALDCRERLATLREQGVRASVNSAEDDDSRRGGRR